MLTLLTHLRPDIPIPKAFYDVIVYVANKLYKEEKEMPMQKELSETELYGFPLYDLNYVKDLREILEHCETIYKDRNAFLVKDPIALRELDPRSEEARKFKKNSDDPYRAIKYSQFAKDVRALGSYLKSIGITKENKVAIIAETRYEWYLSYLAVINGLAVTVPIDKGLQDYELLNNLSRAHVNTILYSNRVRKSLVNLADDIDFVENYINMDLPYAEAHGKSIEDNEINGKKEHYFWDILNKGYEIRANGDTSYDTLDLDRDAFSLLLFTSGTSANSKAVMLSHRNIVTVVNNASRLVDFSDSTLLSLLPLHHTYESTCGFVIQMFMGNTVAVSDGLFNVLKNIKQSKATMLIVVPAILEAIYRIVKRRVSKDKLLLAKLKIGLKISKSFKKDEPKTYERRRKLFKAVHEITGGSLRHFFVGGAYAKPEIMEFFNLLGFVTM